jgi:hypothetical protein
VKQRWPVSVDGGHAPHWRRDGTEVFFIGLDNKSVYTAKTRILPGRIEVSRPIKIFETPDVLMVGGGSYDVTSDGQRFIMLIGKDQGPPVLTVHVNWRSRLPR